MRLIGFLLWEFIFLLGLGAGIILLWQSLIWGTVFVGLWAVTAVVLFNYRMVYGIPKRMLEHLSPQASIKSRCLYGEFGFKSPGVAYLLDDCICVQCITGRLRTFPLKDIQSVREGRWLNGSLLLSPWRVLSVRPERKIGVLPYASLNHGVQFSVQWENPALSLGKAQTTIMVYVLKSTPLTNLR